MNHTVDHTSFSGQIADKLASEGLYDHDWFCGQKARVSMMWNAGETVESAYQTIRVFAEAQLGTPMASFPNPLAAPICIGVREVG